MSLPSFSPSGFHQATQVRGQRTGIDRDAAYPPNPSLPRPSTRIPIPWDIQRYVIDTVAYRRLMVDDDNNVLLAPDDDSPYHSSLWDLVSSIRNWIEIQQTLQSCSLVCRDWATASRELMYQWICLSNHQQTEKLSTLLRDPQLSHLSQNVRRLSVLYPPPYKRIGEVIPRIIGMRLSRLECLDLCADRESAVSDTPRFPFHPSLRAQLSQLNQIRILHLHDFRFAHLAEFRRLVCGFAGVRHLVAIHVEFGKDKLGDSRPIHRSKEWQIPTKVSWSSEGRGDDEYDYTPSILWVANIPNLQRAKISRPKTACPVLTPHVANMINHMSLHTSELGYDELLKTWHWGCEEGRTGGMLVRDWTLSDTSFDGPPGLAFTFRVESDDPNDIPLGFEDLIETYILHRIYGTLELPTDLSRLFKEIQEYIWQFTNAKKVKLAFMTYRSSHAASWRSAPENMKLDLQREHAAVIAIIEEFMRSQTDVDLDFTIDGLSPKESHLLISGVQTNELLWPAHVQIPWNIQRHILESISPYVPDENDDFPESNDHYQSPISVIDTPQREACETLQRCSLVCRQWASVSQQLIFRWIRLASHQQMDKLYTLLSSSGSQSSHLVRRLSIVYRPHDQIGEVIPRIIGMHLSRLEYLDFCADTPDEDDYPIFPFHPSLRAQLSQLNHIRVLSLHGFRFLHLAEFRRFVCSFSGVRHLVASCIRFGHDKLGDCRPIHGSKEWQTLTKVSCSLSDSSSCASRVQQKGDLEVYTPAILWLANIPNSHRVIEISSPQTTNPFLTPHIANAIMDILGRGNDYDCVTWCWRYGEGRTGGPGRDWTLFCVTPAENFRLYFRFHTRSDQPQDVPLGCEHLVELSIPHVAGHTRDLRVSLLQRFQGLQELLGRFTNLKKIDLALTINHWRSDWKPWVSKDEDEKQRLQKQYTAIIAIAEEFIRSQTDFDMGFTIDGLPVEELHLLISNIPTNELLWPVHIPIPWNIQRHIIESVPLFVPPDGTNSVLPFGDLTHSRVADSKPISTVRDQIGACQTLRTCSLVCRQWASVSRRLIFHWTCLSNHQQTDILHSLLRDPQYSHLSQLVRRLSIVYHSPYKKIGEAIPRIIGMGLSQLECLDLCAGDGTEEVFDLPTFPFHPSLRAQLSQLNQVRILHLHNFGFSHLAEFRRFVCAFTGIHHLIAISVAFDRGELTDYRPIHHINELQTPVKVSWNPRVLTWSPKGRGEFEFRTRSILWVANIPNSQRVINTTSSKTSCQCPTLAPHVTSAIMQALIHFDSDRMEVARSWHWQCDEKSFGLGREWTLVCVAPQDHYMIHRFKFRVPVRSNSTPDVPFGFENLIELWIRYTMTMPQELQELDVCLRRNFRELRELFGGFLNVERVNFALLSKDYRLERSHGWESNMTERMRVPQLASLAEDFRSRRGWRDKRRVEMKFASILTMLRRSQADFDLDISIDGVPLEELFPTKSSLWHI
ncbi:hypothetical protein NLI96_g12400 [Meripilus lineatus]|uniref:F-box domain-containing protein n=1 Tax=Meripilus lineatus TaxID=2056292 RepID=A0AAD5UUN9_9APHY|nr:hypothetical protein NLI96_g12400 [Physisporinus lineatus]